MKHELPSTEEIKQLPPDGGPEFNRLVFETSPYLLQHARNPVDWYPWGEQAFEKARAEKKPVFLSIGYSSCHWCHVMAHESFENDEIAALLNRYFVCIKVDREERPDLDDIYMKATQIITQRGGWPNSVFLTPGRRPWYAGTYFPPEDRMGMAGFKTVLNRLHEVWQTKYEDVEAQADQLEASIREMSLRRSDPAELNEHMIDQVLDQLKGGFDAETAGFGTQPKFPPHAQLRFLLDQFSQTQDASALQMLTETLDAMALGGIHDHVGGGFHRYATDRHWLLPHFEKMLYDNAQLLKAYARAWKLTGFGRYRQVAEDIFGWVQREMAAPEGGFYAALDADSEGEEGKFYVWSLAELEDLLGAGAGRFAERYQFKPEGNYQDEATHRRTGMNIPHLSGFIPGAEAEALKQARQTLLQARAQRVRPGLDDKVLVSWNGLMIGALAYAGCVLINAAMVAAAEKCAHFIRTEMWQDKRLFHSYSRGEVKPGAFLEDYVFLADGLLELHASTGDIVWLAWAEELVEVLNDQFAAPSGGYYFTAQSHEKLLSRTQDVFDNVTPSANGVAARVLAELAARTGSDTYRETAEKLLCFFSGDISQLASSALSAVGAWRALRSGPVQVEVAPLMLSPGEQQVTVTLKMAECWHINSSSPLQDYLKPLMVKVDGVTMGSLHFPEPIQERFGFSEAALSVYAGSIELQVPVVMPDDKGSLELAVSYQPCNKEVCEAPAEQHFRLRRL